MAREGPGPARALERIYSGQADTRFEEGLARSPVRDQEEAKLN